MKNVGTLVCALVLILAGAFLTGCPLGARTMWDSPTLGGVYTGTTSPSLADPRDNATPTPKKGISECKSVLGIAAWGDCSVEAAMRAGGIKKVHHIDHSTLAVLFFIYDKYTTTVYGE